jgi:hypothetical protein
MKTKFNALMVNEADKVFVQELREQFKLTEKQVVGLIMDLAVTNREDLEARATKLRSEIETEKWEHKQEKLAEYKAKATQKRKQKSVEKLKEKLARVEDSVGGDVEPAGAETGE